MRDPTRRANAPGVLSRGVANSEGPGGDLNQFQSSTSVQQPQTGPARRRCPHCGHVAAPSAFKATALPSVSHGYSIARRQCPTCQHVGPLTSFARVDAQAVPVGVRR